MAKIGSETGKFRVTASGRYRIANSASGNTTIGCFAICKLLANGTKSCDIIMKNRWLTHGHKMLAFTSTGLNRSAHMRGAVENLLQDPRAKVVTLWRGKPLILKNHLVSLPLGHAMFKHVATPFLYLGQDDGTPYFAADMSHWEPAGLDPSALAMFNDTSIQIHPDAPEGSYFGELRVAMSSLCAVDANLAATARAIFNWHKSHQFCAACGARSEVAMAGWERHCPTCGAKHFPRTDPVVIMLVSHGNALLLGRSHGWPDKMYSALAGFIEPGETLEAAVQREVLEETGILTTQIRYLASQPWPFPSSLMLGCTAIARDTHITLDEELEDARWFSKEDIMQAWAGLNPDLKPARKGSIAHYMIGEWLAGRVD